MDWQQLGSEIFRHLFNDDDFSAITRARENPNLQLLYEADGSWVTQPAVTRDMPAGFYVHIISAGVARRGNWFAWIVDENNRRISALAAFTTDGPGGACNRVTVNFYDS